MRPSPTREGAAASMSRCFRSWNAGCRRSTRCPSGLGQYTLALELATAWLCDRPTPDGACGTCESCHAVDVRTQADLLVLMPETAMMALGWPLSEKAQSDIDDKKRKPSREIRVE